MTSEIVLNGLSIVSFAGHVSPGTSGSCEITDGNIAIFRAGRMEGLIYAEPNSRRGIGSISETEGGLRVWDGSYPYRPWADLRLHGPDLVIVSAVASRNSFCNGTVSLPNIYGIPIHLARRVLLAEGWMPEPAARRTPDVMLPELTEAQDCSGTGFAFCKYAYRSVDGLTLSVVTAGEAIPPSSPGVVSYDVACPPALARD